jgi:acyl-CoA thioester hydrolase
VDTLLSRYPVVIDLPVAWADMDYFRHVNNTVFFRYFESARIAYLERIGFADESSVTRVGPILHSTHCRFRLPLTYPDRVRVGARATELRDDRFTMEYLVVSERLGRRRRGGGRSGGLVRLLGREEGTPPRSGSRRHPDAGRVEPRPERTRGDGIGTAATARCLILHRCLYLAAVAVTAPPRCGPGWGEDRSSDGVCESRASGSAPFRSARHKEAPWVSVDWDSASWY